MYKYTDQVKPEQPANSASAIEKSVTHLLVATKQLLETLTHWSRGTASETDVSDVYVRLGYEFNIACRAFTQVGIDTSELGPVPDVLRSILEDTLSQEATQQSLERYLPRIRDIIINLLHGLKKKQTMLRQKNGREGSGSTRRTNSLASSITPFVEDGTTLQDHRYSSRREGSRDTHDGRTLQHSASNASTASPQRHNSSGSTEPRRTGSSGKTRAPPPPMDVPGSQPPSMPPYPPEHVIPGPAPPPTIQEPPPPTPRTVPTPRPPRQDALNALKQSGELERRASRRYSSYQLRKDLATPAVPLIPPTPAQRGPIPNRGREARESMHAVRSRGSQYLQRNRSRPSSPEQKPEPVTSVRQSLRDANIESQAPVLPPPSEKQLHVDSPNVKTPEDKYAAIPPYNQPSPGESMQATISRPWDPGFPIPEVPEPSEDENTLVQPGSAKDAVPPKELVAEKPKPVVPTKDPTVRQSVVAEPLVLYLQCNNKTKKTVFPGGFSDLRMEKLQYEFIEKFSWNIQNNDVELPEIYIHDLKTGIRHELEDLNDVQNHSLLVLNTDHVNEVKKQVDSSIVELRTLLDTVTQIITAQSASIQQIAKKQQDSADEMSRIASQPPPAAQQSAMNGIAKPPKANQPYANDQLQELRRELAVIRQRQASDLSRRDAELARVKEEALKEANKHSTTVPNEGDSDRAYVDQGKKQMNQGTETLMKRVDDLADKVEVLRKDVTRGSRPRDQDLEQRRTDLKRAQDDLDSLRATAQRETPIWKRIGEKQLKAVMDDQEEIKMNEELFADLAEDIAGAANVFDLVLAAAEKQGQRTSSKSLKQPTAPAGPDAGRSYEFAMSEVRALQPNHDLRIAAIEDAERSRQEYLASGGADDIFKKELSRFVGDDKLKKTGGVEEVERLRIQREADARQANHENQIRLARERAEREAAEAAASSDEEEEDNDIDNDPPRLEVPGLEDDGQLSPEPAFVEAPEAPIPQTNGAG